MLRHMQIFRSYVAIAPEAWHSTMSPWSLPPTAPSLTPAASLISLPRASQLEYLSLLHVTLKTHLRIPENEGLGHSWSAALLAPLLALHASTHVAQVRNGCQAVLHEVLVSLQLQHGAPVEV
jgi:hypothetical protein